MDYSRWIYSGELAAWLSGRTELDVKEQATCICASPHRTVAEKLEGLKELLELHTGEEGLKRKIKAVEALLQRVYSDAPAGKYLYGAEIYWCGDREWFQPQVFYKTAEEAVQEILRRIEKAVAATERKRESFYGVVPIFCDMAAQGYRLVENLVIRHDGEMLYCMPDFDDCNMRDYIGAEPFHAMRIPYFSGTIIEIVENPFMASMTGVLINLEAEPDEEGFEDHNAYYQWMVYPDNERPYLTHGIGVVALRDEYVPFLAGNPCETFPYRQFIRKYEITKENERWLEELSQMIKTDKCFVDRILEDRQPRKQLDMDKQRQKYIREIGKKLYLYHH